MNFFLITKMFFKKNILIKKLRHPGVEPGPPRWQRGIITARLMAHMVLRVRCPGIEPGPPAWKAGILTTVLTTRVTDRI